jgi:hypothetical protein
MLVAKFISIGNSIRASSGCRITLTKRKKGTCSSHRTNNQRERLFKEEQSDESQTLKKKEEKKRKIKALLSCKGSPFCWLKIKKNETPRSFVSAAVYKSQLAAEHRERLLTVAHLTLSIGAVWTPIPSAKKKPTYIRRALFSDSTQVSVV